MEPTIYKPSIYNGAGIYKIGAEDGGLGPYGVDWASGGWTQKQMFRRPNDSVTNGGTHNWYDVPGFGFVAPYHSDRRTTPGVFPLVYTDFLRSDEHEIKISFIFNIDFPGNCILCGNKTGNYGDFLSIEANPAEMVFYAPNTQGWGYRSINLQDVSTSNKKRKKQTLILKHFANTDKFNFSYFVDDVKLSEKEQELTDLIWPNKNHFMLGGIKDNYNNASQRNCWILYESYFKKNGDFMNNSDIVNYIDKDLNILDWT